MPEASISFDSVDVKLTHPGLPRDLFEAAHVDPGASSGDQSIDPPEAQHSADRQDAGRVLQQRPALPQEAFRPALLTAGAQTHQARPFPRLPARAGQTGASALVAGHRAAK